MAKLRKLSERPTRTEEPLALGSHASEQGVHIRVGKNRIILDADTASEFCANLSLAIQEHRNGGRLT